MFLTETFVPFLADQNTTFWFPEQASTFAPEIDSFFWFLFWLCTFFFVVIVAGMIYFCMKFRDRPGYQGSPEALHNTPLEVTWTVLPTFLVIYIFVRGTVGFLDMASPPSDTLDVNVTASKWNWQFTYPNGAITNELHLPVNRPAKMVMRSNDVIHSLFVPAFRAKADIVPGRFNLMWFQPTKEGTYDLFCTEYCGDNHSRMLAKVVVEPREAYEKWVAEQAKPPTEPDKHGQWLYERMGCKGCHSIEKGVRIQGPSFHGSWGTDVTLAGGKGTVKFDEEFVRRSIMDPQAQARSGFESASAMPTYQGRLKQNQIEALIEFMKTLKD